MRAAKFSLFSIFFDGKNVFTQLLTYVVFATYMSTISLLSCAKFGVESVGNDKSSSKDDTSSSRLTDQSQNNDSSTNGQRFAKTFESCRNVKEFFRAPRSHLQSSAKFLSDFSLIKDLRGDSKGGAFPAIVRNDKTNRVLFVKIFPKYKEIQNFDEEIKFDPSYTEIFNTCRNAKIDKSYGIDGGKNASMFFVDFYELGFLKTKDPFNGREGRSLYPYIVTESIDGWPMTKISFDATNAQSALGYNFGSLPPKGLQSVLLQIVIALKNVELAYAGQHYDLHTGNILLTKGKDSVTFNGNYRGRVINLHGPQVKIIDFGLSAVMGSLPRGNVIHQNWIANRSFITELGKFIQNESAIPFDVRRKISSIRSSDVKMLNQIMQAVKPRLVRSGIREDAIKVCANLDECMDMIAGWW